MASSIYNIIKVTEQEFKREIAEMDLFFFSYVKQEM